MYFKFRNSTVDRPDLPFTNTINTKGLAKCILTPLG